MATSVKLVGIGDDDGSVGSRGWTNPENITADDGAPATAFVAEEETHFLKGVMSGNVFAVPAGATINGIVVEIKRKLSIGSGITGDFSVRLVKGDVISGTDKAVAGAWTTSYVVASYGGASDLWGLTLTPDDVNAPDFGAVLSVTSNDADTADVDYFKLSVYYTAAAVGGSRRRTLVGVG